MAKKKQQPDVSKQYKIPLTSYTVQTAKNILSNYDVTMSRRDLVYQLMDNNSFYKRLLRIPALGIYNEYLLHECSDICDYCQEELINVIFANQSMMDSSPENKEGLSDKQQQKLDDLQERSDEISESFEDVRKDQEAIANQCGALLALNIKKWKKLVEESADKVIDKLEGLGFSLSIDFHDKLVKRLDKQGAGINFSKDALAAFHLKDKISGIEKAILSTLIEESQHEQK